MSFGMSTKLYTLCRHVLYLRPRHERPATQLSTSIPIIGKTYAATDQKYCYRNVMLTQNRISVRMIIRIPVVKCNYYRASRRKSTSTLAVQELFQSNRVIARSLEPFHLSRKAFWRHHKRTSGFSRQTHGMIHQNGRTGGQLPPNAYFYCNISDSSPIAECLGDTIPGLLTSGVPYQSTK